MPIDRRSREKEDCGNRDRSQVRRKKQHRNDRKGDEHKADQHHHQHRAALFDDLRIRSPGKPRHPCVDEQPRDRRKKQRRERQQKQRDDRQRTKDRAVADRKDRDRKQKRGTDQHQVGQKLCP